MTHLDEILTIKGKNLFDKSNYNYGKYVNCLSSPYGNLADGNFNCSDFIKIKPNTNYTFTIPAIVSSGGAGLAWYSDKSDSSYISHISGVNYGGTIFTKTSPANAQYVRFTFSAKNTTSANSVMLEEGSSATIYEPYTNFKSIGNIWERAIPTDSTKGAITIINNSRKSVNLFDLSKAEEKWIGVNGAFSRSGNCKGIQFEVEQGATYYFTTDWTNISSGSRFTCLAEYDANKVYISGTRKLVQTPVNNIEQNSVSISNPNTKYVAFATYTTSPNWWMIRKMIIQQYFIHHLVLHK